MRRLHFEHGAAWGAHTALASRAPAREAQIVDAPVPVGRLVSPEGARSLAAATRADSPLDCFDRLLEWRLSAPWALTGLALVAWLQDPARGADAWNATVQDLARNVRAEPIKLLLLPAVARGPSAPARGSDVVRQHAVATILRARFDASGALRDGPFATLEPHLLDGRFGDPRLLNVSEHWDRVRSLAPRAYAADLEGLVRDDIAFFFREAMEEADREAFWLRYVRSVRKTVAVVDPGVYERIRARLEGASREMKGALGRAVRTSHTSGADRASAFCLYFDHLVVVEFSVSGNAAYVDDRRNFEETIWPAVMKNGRIWSPASLKRPDAVIERLKHMSQWTSRFAEALARHGIVRDASGTTGTPPPLPALR